MGNDKGLTPEDLELINPNDFQSIETHVILTNQATNTTTSGKGEIKVVEFLEDGLIIEAPAKVCAQGHLVLLQIAIAGGGAEAMTFQSTAKVEKAETSPEQVDRLDLVFIQHDYEQWEKVKKLFAQRQEQILEFFKAAKGW